jgi:hypothetical protein
MMHYSFIFTLILLLLQLYLVKNNEIITND